MIKDFLGEVTIRRQIGVLIINHNQDVLVLTRNPERYAGHGFIKGGVEPGESLQQALEREVKEEVGVTITSDMTVVDINYSSAHFHTKKEYIGFVRWYAIILPPDQDALTLSLDATEWLESRFLSYKKAQEVVTWQTELRALQHTIAKVL